MVTSLDDLKAEVAAEEANEAEQVENVSTDELGTETSQESEDETEIDKADDESGKTEEDRESESGGADKEEVEDWLKGDDHTSQAEKKFTDGDIGRVKAKLKTKLEKRHESETEKLQARINELESEQTVKPSELQKPKRDDFLDNDDPDEAYDEALTGYIIAKGQATTAAAAATTQNQNAQKAQELKISQGEDQHYERASILVNESGITAEKYQAADSAFKQAIDIVVPNGGDDIAAGLVSKLGAGSEKVVYNIGVNKAKQEKFTELLKSDPSGFEAYGYLVELKVQLNSSAKRRTSAPTPAAEVKGDMSLNGFKKQLAKAESDGDVQGQVSLMRKIRLAGRAK